MNAILQLFDINNTFFTIFNYQMSYIEFFGTLLNLACVWLVAKKHILNWPVGILAVFLFGALFYQLNLYADIFEQIYFLITGLAGWFIWTRNRQPDAKPNDIVVVRNSLKANLAWLGVIGAGTWVGAWAMSNIHLWLPGLFPEPAALPVLDVFTTVMSFVAQYLMIRKKFENWILWILVDVIGIGLYWYKGVPFVALLYAVFLVMATQGLITWYKTFKEQNNEKGNRGREVLAAS